MAVGIDVGTGNIVAARKNEEGKIVYTHERNSFISVGKWNVVKNQLKRTRIAYTKLGDDVYVLGTAAYDYANIFGEVELRRPMAMGMLNPREQNALPIMKELLKNILGDPQTKDEICVYVTPSEPIDTGDHTVYHEDVIETIIKSLGYTPVNIKESVALAYAGLVDENLTGIAISFGAGMANAAVMFQGLTALDFSVTKSGDYIDQNAAKETDLPVAHMTALKESEGFTLDPAKEDDSRASLAVLSYYRFVVKNILTQVINLFTTSKGMPHFKEPIKIVCGGGTSMAEGFIQLFESEFKSLEFPIKVKSFEMVSDPLYAVSRGALSEGIIEEEDE